MSHTKGVGVVVEREQRVDGVTQILDALKSGDPQGSEKLLPLVYEELRRLAAQKMAQEAAEHTLQPTALVHEAYMRVVGSGTAQKWDHRGHFYAAAAEAMRRILIDAARRKASLKRGSDWRRIELTSDFTQGAPVTSDHLLALDEALQRLEESDPDSFNVVMLRYFGGLNVEDTAAALGISPRTVKRHWSFARAWLQREIDRE